jgi:hypothetical protein
MGVPLGSVVALLRGYRLWQGPPAATMLLAMMLDIAQNGCNDWVVRFPGLSLRTCVKSRVSRTLLFGRVRRRALFTGLWAP